MDFGVIFLKCIRQFPQEKVDAKLAEVVDEVFIAQAKDAPYSIEDGVEVRVDRDGFEGSGELCEWEGVIKISGTHFGW